MPDNDSTYPPLGGQGFPPDPGDGTAQRGPDPYTRYLLEQKLAPRVDPVVGNFADLQRAGADAAQGLTTTSSISSIAPPPGVDLKSNESPSPAQVEAARGEWTRETERVGLLGSPPPDRGGDGHTESVVIDPTSSGPQVVSEGKGNTGSTSTSSTATKK